MNDDDLEAEYSESDDESEGEIGEKEDDESLDSTWSVRPVSSQNLEQNGKSN